VTGVTKIALVPLVVLWLWALPRDQPSTEVAAALVPATVEVADSDSPLGPETTSVDLTSTTLAPTTSAILVLPEDADSTTPSAAQVETSIPDTSTTSVASSTPQSPATASTAVVESTSPPEPPEALATVPIGQLALDRMSFDWQAAFPQWRVEFAGPRQGIRALTYPHEKRVEVFVRADDTPESLHRVFAHELGHVIDVELNNNDDRQRWIQQRGLPAGAPWWPDAAAPDFATGAGDFAEAFAVMETGVVSRSSIGSQPTADDLDLLRELMRG